MGARRIAGILMVRPLTPMHSTTIRIAVLIAATFAASCQRNNAPESREGPPASKADPAVSYPAPRWPSYFKKPESVDELMPAARALVRNKSGFLGVGMGVLQEGESVLLAPNAGSDPNGNPERRR